MQITYLNTPTKNFSKRNSFAHKKAKSQPVMEKFDRKKTIQKNQIEARRILKTEHLLQLTTVMILSAFGVLLVPNLIANDNTKAIASEPSKVELLSQVQQTSSIKPVAPTALVEAGLDQPQSIQTPQTNTVVQSQDTNLNSKTYIVGTGEDLNQIAQKLNIDPIELALTNNLKSSKITAGTQLKLP
jgi:hypothetical protein